MDAVHVALQLVTHVCRVAGAARRNKAASQRLAERAAAFQDVLHNLAATRGGPTPRQLQGVRLLGRVLDDAATLLEKIDDRNKLGAALNASDDQDALQAVGAALGEASDLLQVGLQVNAAQDMSDMSDKLDEVLQLQKAQWGSANEHAQQGSVFEEGMSIEELVDLLRRRTTATKEKTKAAGALWNLAAGSEAVCESIASAGAIAPLVALLREGDAQGRTKAAGALQNLAHGSEARRESIASAGAIAPLVALLREGDAQGRANAAGALWNLAAGSEAVCESIASAGAIAPLVALLREGDAQGRANAAAALRNLACGSEARRESIASAGAIAPLVALLRAGDAQGRAKAAAALRNLAIDAPMRRCESISSALAKAGLTVDDIIG